MATDPPASNPAASAPPPPAGRNGGGPRRGAERPRKARKGTRLLLWVTAIGLVLSVGFAVGLAILLQDGGGSLADNSGRWLYLRMSSLTDAPTTGGLLDDPADLPPLTTEMTQLIRDAAEDDEIPGILFDVAGAGVGWAQTQELRDALVAFQESGKPCIAWGDAFGNREYYLASACGEIQVAPAGLVLPNGLAMTQTYFAEALEKIDVHPNFEHVGNFKSAVEPYERTGPSEYASEATVQLLDGIFDQLVEGIAVSRGVSTEQALAWVQAPPMTAEKALEMGMVDRLSFRDQVKDQVELHDGVAPAGDAAADDAAAADGAADAPAADTDDEDRTELRHYRDYLKQRRKAWRKSGSSGVRVAVIYAEGQIMPGDSSTDIFGGMTIGDRTVRKQLTQVREDDDIDAVVLRVNSPGGSGTASDAIWREVVLTAAEKPFVVSMSDYAASGGYYISMAADHIVAQPGTLTGSIGVFGGKLNLSGAMAKVGLSQHTWKRGERSTLLSSNHDFDEGDRELFRRYLESFYDTFVTKAADGRGVSFQELHAVAQGRVWTGTQALERGLVDELGGLDVAIDRAVERLELAEAPDQVEIVRIPARKTFFEQIMEELEGGSDRSVDAQVTGEQAVAMVVTSALPEARAALSGAIALRQLAASGDVAAMMPALIEID